MDTPQLPALSTLPGHLTPEVTDLLPKVKYEHCSQQQTTVSFHVGDDHGQGQTHTIMKSVGKN